MPQCIGIIAITGPGASACYNVLTKTGDHPEIAMHHFPFAAYKPFVEKNDWVGMADKILESIARVKAAGADFVIIPSNTPHYGYKRIASNSPIPVLNLIDITVDACQRYGKVAVLGTKPTMEGALYAKPLSGSGVIPVIPEPELRDEINAIIYKIIDGAVTDGDISQLSEKLKGLDCEAYILGCTELPVVFNEAILGKPCIDTTSILAEAALERANTPIKGGIQGASSMFNMGGSGAV
jgi:aspartate racemase